MKATIAPLFGLITIACANNYPNQRTTRRQNQLPPPVSDDDVKKFKERSQVKDEVELKIQEISKDLPFVFEDEDISFGDEDLDVISVFTLDAEVVVDGVSQTALSRVFTSKKDPEIIIVIDTNGMLVAATKINKLTGKSTDVTLISKLNGDNAYATVTPDDLDDEKLEKFRREEIMPPGETYAAVTPDEKFRMEDFMPPGEAYATATPDDMDDENLETFRMEDFMSPVETRRLRGPQVHDFVDVSEHVAIDDDHRSIQESCSFFNVIEMAIVVDSSLCEYAGGSSEVNTLAQAIVATASRYYEVPGLCKKLKISYLEIHCDPDTDPIRNFLILAGNSNVCGNSNGLLQKFTGYVFSNSIIGDVVHLFHGKDFTRTSSIGCAYVGTLCSTSRSRPNTGVDEINFSDSLTQQSKLVAHETGHNCNAIHIEDDTNDVMSPSVCGSCNNAFGETSKNSINAKVASTTCTSVETQERNGGGGAQGDPHFKTWRGHHFDFHGECDLVLLHSSEFGSGLGLDVHIRTKFRHDMSYISSATLRIGTDILEVESQGVYYLNGVIGAELPNEFSGFAFSHTQPTDNQHAFTVHLGVEENINVKTYKDFVSVLILKGQGKHFGDSVGLMGDFGKGRMLARDGKTVLDDANAFGQEWQVLESEAILFRRLRLPQQPMECTLPPPMQTSQIRRRLLESSVDELAAEKACAHWGEGKDDCVFDVLTTGDLEMAMVGAY
jgi:hypothetical protein